MKGIEKIQDAQAFLREKNVFLVIYYLSIAAVIIGFIYSRALLSIGQIAISANFLLEGQYLDKIRRLKEDKLPLLLAGLYLIHVLGLLYTSDFVYAAEDLRIKLPLLMFPIVFGSTDILGKREFKFVLYFFVLTILSSTIVIFVNYQLNGKTMLDIREASFLISHIRLALMICLSIAICIYFASKEQSKVAMILMVTSIWLTGFMIFFAYLTGIVILSILALFLLFWYLRRSQVKTQIKLILLTLLIAISASVLFYISSAATDYLQKSRQKQVSDLNFTANGNPYAHWYDQFNYGIRENGYLVFQNVSFKEVQNEWNKRSEYKVDYSDDRFLDLEDIILRFLASKGLPKDSASVASLSQVEIEAVEKGLTNVNYLGKSRLYNRLYNMFWQFDVYTSGGNFNGHSLGIRMEFWKTGWHVFERNWLFGTGTGDIENEFQVQYDLDNSKLQKEWRFRSHNQFISFAATFGIFGLMYFIIAIFLPFVRMKNKFLYLSFAIIFILSILTEDTLETQIGVTFYAFFNSLLLFQNRSLKASSSD